MTIPKVMKSYPSDRQVIEGAIQRGDPRPGLKRSVGAVNNSIEMTFTAHGLSRQPQTRGARVAPGRVFSLPSSTEDAGPASALEFIHFWG
jgi:hypothetical protein